MLFSFNFFVSYLLSICYFVSFLLFCIPVWEVSCPDPAFPRRPSASPFSFCVFCPLRRAFFYNNTIIIIIIIIINDILFLIVTIIIPVLIVIPISTCFRFPATKLLRTFTRSEWTSEPSPYMYIYIYICMYVCMYVCTCVYV